MPQVDTADPAAGYLATLSTLAPAAQIAALSAAVYGEAGTPQAVTESAETRLALARAQIVTGGLDDAAGTLADLAGGDLADWRTTWYQGLRELAAGQPAAAHAAFDSVYDELPGELAPSWRWGSPLRPPETGPPPPVTSAGSGRSTAPSSAPHSGSPGSGWRRMTGLGDRGAGRGSADVRLLTWRPRSWPSGFISPAPASQQ